MKKFFKWLVSLFSSNNTVVTVGNGNTTTVTQISTVHVLKGRDPKGSYEYKLQPLTQEGISQIATKADRQVVVIENI